MSAVISLVPATKRRLRLYVAGESSTTLRARAQCRRLCGVVDGLTIDEVDVLASPEATEEAGVLATPTLSDETLTPPRRIVGDLADIGRVLDFFGLDRSPE